MNKQDTLVTEFDCLTTGGTTQLIKAIIPLLNPAQQRILAIMTRVWELILTIKFFERTCFQNDGTPLTANLNPEMVNRIKRYCTPESQQTIDMLLNFMNMSELMKMMNMFNGEGAPGDMGGITDLFKNFSQFTTPAPDAPKSSGHQDGSDHRESSGNRESYDHRESSGPSSMANLFDGFDPSSLMQTMMNPEQSGLYQEFMEKLDLDFNENE